MLRQHVANQLGPCLQHPKDFFAERCSGDNCTQKRASVNLGRDGCAAGGGLQIKKKN
eukprot:EC849492.1.p2 GENE.EC849492.1~~EC849492.1.p2  ORF type:complete len:57 (-),score=12.77 EC849492.1:287-457(-)